MAPIATASDSWAEIRPLSLPSDRPLRIVGDVHGDSIGFAYAAGSHHFVVQLGDLVDGGADSAGALRIMFRLIDEGRGLFLLGNHDLKLARALDGQRVQVGPELAATIGQLDDDLRRRVVHEIRRAPAWLWQGNRLFVHGGFHTDMLDRDAPALGLERPTGAVARAVYGEPTGRTRADGFPERSLRWVDRIPPGRTIYCGHDRRSIDGRPYIRHGMGGGVAVFLDTGAGKGGHLSWIDLPPVDGSRLF